MGERLFPIMSIGYRYDEETRKARQDGCTALFIALPWAMLAPHEQQAQRNHSQSLARLAERGGLAESEAVAVLEDRRWHSMSKAAANARLADLLREFEANQRAAPPAKLGGETDGR